MSKTEFTASSPFIYRTCFQAPVVKRTISQFGLGHNRGKRARPASLDGDITLEFERLTLTESSTTTQGKLSCIITFNKSAIHKLYEHYHATWQAPIGIGDLQHYILQWLNTIQNQSALSLDEESQVWNESHQKLHFVSVSQPVKISTLVNNILLIRLTVYRI